MGQKEGHSEVGRAGEASEEASDWSGKERQNAGIALSSPLSTAAVLVCTTEQAHVC